MCLLGLFLLTHFARACMRALLCYAEVTDKRARTESGHKAEVAFGVWLSSRSPDRKNRPAVERKFITTTAPPSRSSKRKRRWAYSKKGTLARANDSLLLTYCSYTNKRTMFDACNLKEYCSPALLLLDHLFPISSMARETTVPCAASLSDMYDMSGLE